MTRGTANVAIVATLDTKADEVAYLREQVTGLGGSVTVVDIGVIGEAGTATDLSRAEVAAAGGKSLDELLQNPTRQEAVPVMVAGATKLLTERAERGEIHAVLGLGGTQGTSTITEIMRSLPYGFPKVMLSTVASGDVAAFVDIKDVTMMFSVTDILGLNSFARSILANAAGAAWGMAQARVPFAPPQSGKPLIGMTNLGVLTEGSMHAIDLFEKAGYEVVVFHAVGSGGRAMEQMMKEGIIGAVFDYALGEISDELFDGLRAGGAERLTVAGKLGLPQVLCPGGAEHIGLIVEPNTPPPEYENHQYVFHNPIIFAPRLDEGQLGQVAAEVGRRLESTNGNACLMFPQRGTSRYGVEGGELRNPDSDASFAAELERCLPDSVEFVKVDAGAEDPAFVEAAVGRLIAMMEG